MQLENTAAIVTGGASGLGAATAQALADRGATVHAFDLAPSIEKAEDIKGVTYLPVDVTDVGAASGVVSFFRSLGGAVGIAVLGAVLSNRVADTSAGSIKELVASGRLSRDEAAQVAQGGGLDLDNMPALAETAIRHAYGDDIGVIFVIASVFALVTLLAIWRMPRTDLRTTVEKHEPQESTEAS